MQGRRTVVRINHGRHAFTFVPGTNEGLGGG